MTVVVLFGMYLPIVNVTASIVVTVMLPKELYLEGQ